MSKKKQEQNQTQQTNTNSSNKEYEKILDELIDMIGGREYCLRQLLFEGDHKKFISEYRKKHRDFILEQLPKFYDSVPYDEKNIIDVEISSGAWNKFILKIFYFDQEYNRFFEFSIKTNRIEEVSLFEACDDEESKSYSRSFFSKLKGGNLLWDKYSKVLEAKQMEEYAEKLQKEKQLFNEKMKKFKFIPSDELKDLGYELIEAPEQYKDGKTRYLHKNNFYYQLVGIDGYITFHEGSDIMMDPAFARNFYEKIVKKLRDN
jgi:hypothetical protein